MDLTQFFYDQGIDLFSEVSIDDLSDEDKASVIQFFPVAQSVIVFGKEVPVSVYRMSKKEKTPGLLLSLKKIRSRLSPFRSTCLSGLLTEKSRDLCG